MVVATRAAGRVHPSAGGRGHPQAPGPGPGVFAAAEAGPGQGEELVFLSFFSYCKSNICSYLVLPGILYFFEELCTVSINRLKK